MKNTTGYRSFLVGSTALTRGQRVQLASNGSISPADHNNGEFIGVVTDDLQASAAGAPVYGTVQLISAPGTFEMVASGAVSVAGLVYPDASGAVSGTSVSSNTAIGRALTAATAAGDIIEVLIQTPAE